MAWWGILWKNEIHGFWDVKVGIASKCPNMSTIKLLVHKYFEFGTFCTWPNWSVCHGLGRWLGGVFFEKKKFMVFKMWRFEWPPNEYHKILGARMFNFDVYCTWLSWSVWHGLGTWLGGMFCEKMKLMVFEMRSLGSPKNVPKWVP